MDTTQLRRKGELAVPGFGIGLGMGFVAGGLAALVGQPLGWALTTGLALGLPLAVLGGAYGLLVASGTFKPGVFAPAALYWLVGFPLARLVHETTIGLVLLGRPTPPDDILAFLVFQALVSMGFSIGFVWLHERLMPGWVHRIRTHNPDAERVFSTYVMHAEDMWNAREQSRARRADRKRTTRPGTAPQAEAPSRGTATRSPSRRA